MNSDYQTDIFVKMHRIQHPSPNKNSALIFDSMVADEVTGNKASEVWDFIKAVTALKYKESHSHANRWLTAEEYLLHLTTTGDIPC